MQQCSHCGRENEQLAVSCIECGTEFVAPGAQIQAASPRDRTWLEWLRYLLTGLATLVVAGLIYLLSLGPVQRYCIQTISRTWTKTENGHETVYTIVRT